MEKDYKDLKFTDDFMFCKVLSTNPDLCRELLALILKKDVKKIRLPEKQKPIEITSDGKGIRLDVYIEDDDTVYDIEMQTTIHANLPKRTRYYQGMIDLNLIERGADYSELKPTYIIFICLEDPFDKGAPVYTMRNRCVEYDDLYLQDESIKVFLNASGSLDYISKELREFLLYVATGKIEGELSNALDHEVSKAKNKEEWRTEYMTLLMRDREKYNEGKAEGIAVGKAVGKAEGIAVGKAEGLSEGKIMMLLSLVDDGIIDMQEAVKRSGLSENEVIKFREEH
jgi:predicted transposase/invertase (TIGR01784 family)